MRCRLRMECVLVALQIVFILSFFIPEVYALEYGLGLSAVEEGDDRIRPAVLLHVAKRDFGSVRLHHWGRKYGPILERGYMLSANYELDVFQIRGKRFMYGAFGLAALVETTSIDVPDEAVSETNYNLGVNIGVFADAPWKLPFVLKLGWESHVFPAGEAAILLSNGRKQVISVISGVNF